MMDMLLVPEASAMCETPNRIAVRSDAPEISRDPFISKVE
jgi:hypothetical protein